MLREDHETLGPGPMSYDPEQVHKGLLHTSTKRSVLGTKFGGPPSPIKKDRQTVIGSQKALGPGPGAYDTEKMANAVALTKARRSGTVKFGRSERGTTASKPSKAEGQALYYDTPSSIGPQVLSKKSTATSKSFGRRVGPACKADRLPGPHSYQPKFNHKKSTISNIRFGTSERTFGALGEHALSMSLAPTSYETPGTEDKCKCCPYMRPTHVRAHSYIDP